MRRARLAALTAALLAAPRAAFAQHHAAPRSEPPATNAPPPDASSDDDARARERFFEGAAALDRGDFDAALAALRESNRLRPQPVTVLNIAQTYRAQGLPLEAIASYEEYLRVAGPASLREHGEAVAATIALLRRSIARLALETDPPGATVSVDGRLVGTTPLPGPVALMAGPHALAVRLPDHVPLAERVSLVAGATLPLRLRLATLSTAASLAIALRERVPAARVAIDGLGVGAPPLSRRLDPGGHRVEVTAPSRVPFRAEIVLAPRQQRSLTVRLEPDTSLVARPWFWVVVGAVAVAGAVTAVVLATRPLPDPTDLYPVGPLGAM